MSAYSREKLAVIHCFPKRDNFSSCPRSRRRIQSFVLYVPLFSQQFQERTIDEYLPALPSAYLLRQTKRGQTLDDIDYRLRRQLQRPRRLANGKDGFALHPVVKSKRRSCAPSQSFDTLPVFVRLPKDCLRGAGRLLRCFRHPFEKEGDPRLPIAFLTNGLEQVVVDRAMRFKIKAEIEKRLFQRLLVDQQQGDKQAAYPAVAIKERVDRLELNMEQRGLNQRGRPVGNIVQKLLPGIQTGHDLAGRRRYKRGC